MTVKTASYLNLSVFRVDLRHINYEPWIFSIHFQIRIYRQYVPDSVTLQSNHLYKADETLYEMRVYILDGYGETEYGTIQSAICSWLDLWVPSKDQKKV